MPTDGRDCDDHDLVSAIKDLGGRLGAHLVKIAPVDRWREPPPFDPARVRVYPHSGHQPTELLPGARSVIVVAVRYLDGLIAHMATPCRTTTLQNNFGYVHLNRKLHAITLGIAEWLEDRGHRSLPLGYNIGGRYDVEADTDPTTRGVAYGLFSMKRAAVLAGLGRAARNGLVASPEFGTRMRLGAVVTVAALRGDPLLEGHGCPEACDICVGVCPTAAIDHDRGVHHLRCFADAGRMGTTYDRIKSAFKVRYPADLPGVDCTANDFLAIDGNAPHWCKLACMVFCPLGERRLPDVWRAARSFSRIVPRVELSGFRDR